MSGPRTYLAVAVLGAAAAATAAAAETAPIQIQSGDQSVTIQDADRPILQYVHGPELFKPYVKQLFTPGGVNVLLDSPPDHIHHHGLMFAVGMGHPAWGMEGVDFWAETEACGRQVHRAVGDTRSQARDGLATATFSERIDWAPPKADKPVAHEVRSVTVYRGAAPDATLLTWQTRLEAAEGHPSVRLSGSHYFGLGMRFIRSMDAAGPFFTPKGPVDGEVVRGDERLTAGTWCAYTAMADGKPVTVAMFDDPKNPRPVLWFTMTKPFAYLSATVNLYREPMTLEAGKPLAFTYGVAVWDGKVEAGEIEKLYRRWLGLAAPKAEESSTKPGAGAAQKSGTSSAGGCHGLLVKPCASYRPHRLTSNRWHLWRLPLFCAAPPGKP